jgi:hypothetical protein
MPLKTTRQIACMIGGNTETNVTNLCKKANILTKSLFPAYLCIHHHKKDPFHDDRLLRIVRPGPRRC